MKLKQFQITQAQKAGIDINLPENKAYFDALPDVDVPETVVTGIDNSLISIQDAKNNHPDIKAHYFVQALNSVDSTLEDVMKGGDFADSDRAAVKNERSTYKRLELVLNKINQAADNKIKNANPGSKAHQQEIDALQTQLRDKTAAMEAAAAQHAADLLSYRIQTQKGILFAKGAMPTIYDALPEDIRQSSLNHAADIELAKKGLKLGFDENGQAILQKADGSNYYGADNRIVSPQKFFESAFSESKIIVPNPGANGTGGQTAASSGAPTHIQAAQSNGGKTDINAGAQAHNRRMLEMAEKSANERQANAGIF